MDAKKTLAWLDELCQQAITEARAGNALLANKLGANPATAHYLNNVFGTKMITPDAWTQHYPQYLTEADGLREAYEAQANTQQTNTRLSAIEEELKKLRESLEPPAAKKGSKKLTEDADKTDTPADGEGKAEDKKPDAPADEKKADADKPEETPREEA